MELHPDIWFSESELEQAGLLDDNDSCTVAPSPDLAVDSRDQQQQQSLCNLQSPPTGLCSFANRLHILAECWQVPCLGRPSSSSLQESTTQHGSLVEDVALHKPPLPEEAPQRWNSFQQLAPAEHTTSTQGRSMPTDSTAVTTRKQTNRDHQKKFRMRQKVLFGTDLCLPLISHHSRMCLLAASSLPGCHTFAVH